EAHRDPDRTPRLQHGQVRGHRQARPRIGPPDRRHVDHGRKRPERGGRTEGRRRGTRGGGGHRTPPQPRGARERPAHPRHHPSLRVGGVRALRRRAGADTPPGLDAGLPDSDNRVPVVGFRPPLERDGERVSTRGSRRGSGVHRATGPDRPRRTRTRHRRLASAIALAVLATAVLAACGSSSKGAVTLNWYVFPEPSGSFAAAASECSAGSHGAYNIKINFLSTSSDQQRVSLVRRLAASDSSIDILAMDVDWTAEFATAKWLKPVP